MRCRVPHARQAGRTVVIVWMRQVVGMAVPVTVHALILPESPAGRTGPTMRRLRAGGDDHGPALVDCGAFVSPVAPRTPRAETAHAQRDEWPLHRELRAVVGAHRRREP